jgi:hypothetical protein
MSKQCQALGTALAAVQIYQIRLSVISVWNIHDHAQPLSKYQMAHGQFTDLFLQYLLRVAEIIK